MFGPVRQGPRRVVCGKIGSTAKGDQHRSQSDKSLVVTSTHRGSWPRSKSGKVGPAACRWATTPDLQFVMVLTPQWRHACRAGKRYGSSRLVSRVAGRVALGFG